MEGQDASFEIDWHWFNLVKHLQQQLQDVIHG